MPRGGIVTCTLVTAARSGNAVAEYQLDLQAQIGVMEMTMRVTRKSVWKVIRSAVGLFLLGLFLQ